MIPAARWTPLLTGSEASRARALVDQAVAATIAAGPEGLGCHLFGGHAGLALLHTELARGTPRGLSSERAFGSLERALDLVAHEAVQPGLFSGLAGVGFALSLHQELVLQNQDHEVALGQLDQALLASLAQPRWPGSFDLFDGVAGIGVYLLERLPRAAAVEGLFRVLDHLEALGADDGSGLAWPGDLALDPGSDGPFWLGAAHGNLGPFALMGLLSQQPPFVARARVLVRRSAQWVLPRAQRVTTPGPFPAVGPEARARARVGWCAGEPGIGAALLVASPDAATRELALEVARGPVDRPVDGWGVNDLSICHGVAGVAHTYNRLFQVTGEPAFERIARRGFDSLCRQLEAEETESWKLCLTRNGYRCKPGLVEGLAGVALALWAATSADEPAWDRAFVLSSRPPHAPPLDGPSL